MTDFSFKNHVRLTVDQLCGLNSVAYSTQWGLWATDEQFCHLLGIPSDEFIERRKFARPNNLWDAARVAKELNIPVEQVNILHAQGRIIGWAEDEERGTVYPAHQFAGGKLFDRIQQVVEPLRIAGQSDKEIDWHLFTPKYELGGFAYAHLMDESSDHAHWVLGRFRDAVEGARASRYIRDNCPGITADTVTPVSMVKEWRSLKSAEAIEREAEVEYQLRVDRAINLEKLIGVSFKTLLLREHMSSPFPANLDWIKSSELCESFGVTEEELDKLLTPAPTSEKWKREYKGESVYNYACFVRDSAGRVTIHPVAHRIEVLLGELAKAGYYTYGADPIWVNHLYLGNVSMIDYALISPEHEEAIISLLERTIERTKEANERKRGKKKSGTEEL